MRRRVVLTCYVEVDPKDGPYADDEEVRDAFTRDAFTRGAEDVVVDVDDD